MSFASRSMRLRPSAVLGLFGSIDIASSSSNQMQ
jgi:hypothetical protein